MNIRELWNSAAVRCVRWILAVALLALLGIGLGTNGFGGSSSNQTHSVPTVSLNQIDAAVANLPTTLSPASTPELATVPVMPTTVAPAFPVSTSNDKITSDKTVMNEQFACTLLPLDTDRISGDFQSAAYSTQSCTQFGSTQAVGVVVLDESAPGSNMATAYRAQLAFSENWAAENPYWNESISPLVGYTHVYEIIPQRDNSVALVGIDPALGLVMRVTADHNTPANLLVLEEAFAGDEIQIGAN